MATTACPIDPHLPQRDQYGGTNDPDHMSEQNFASLVHAVNSTEKDDSAPTIEHRKRKRGDTTSSRGEGEEEEEDDDNSHVDLSIPKRSKPYSLKYPYADREASPFLSPTVKTGGPDPSSALFRKDPRAPAKKYTRPPTKEVFQSLKIGTEEWVRLEAEAKAFMLDETHPERQASVGNRGAAPTNDTKIQLFKTVQRFLGEGAGECYFGRAGDEGEDRWIYPRDEDRLIGLLTPLMRRMVTNERQRQYARRTRQGGSGGKSVEPEGLLGGGNIEHTPTEQKTAKSSPIRNKAVEPPTSDAPFPSNATLLIYINPSSQILHRQTLPRPSQTTYTTLMTTINNHLLSTTASRLNLPGLESIASPPQMQSSQLFQSTTDPAIDDQVRTAREAYQAAYEAHKAALQKAALAAAAQVCPSFEIEVHGVSGLVKVGNEESWSSVVEEVEENEWMGGWIRVLVRVSDG